MSSPPPFRCETGFVDLTADSSSDNDEIALSSAKKPRPLSAIRRLARQGGLKQPPWRLADPSHTDSPTLETSRQSSADLDQERADSTDCESDSDASVAAMPSIWPSWKVMRQLIGMQTPPRRERQPPTSRGPHKRRGSRRQIAVRVSYCEVVPKMPAKVWRGTEHQIDRWHALHGVERPGEVYRVAAAPGEGRQRRAHGSDEESTSSSSVDSEDTDVDSDCPEDPEALVRSINRKVLRLPEGYLEMNVHKFPELVEVFTQLLE